MTTPTHLLLGLVIGKISILAGIHADPQVVYTLGAVSALIPDIDIVYYGLGVNHHQSLLHKPFVWFTGLLFVALYFIIMHETILLSYVIIFSLGVLSHFLLDMGNYTEGVRWLWPISRKSFHLFPLAKQAKQWKKRFTIFTHHPAFLFEGTILISSLFFIIFFNNP